ncbi:MAG: DUF1570 domain-containing protein [Pirellulaceae bacterium]|nr:DUF1570 domain-containing protein [Pirellulaceae bacterium]
MNHAIKTFPLSLSFCLYVAFSFSSIGSLRAQPDDPPGRWELETLVLKDETKLRGLIQAENDEEIDFAQIVQPPGKPMYAVIRGVPRADIAKIEKLPADKHRQLVDRFARFRNRAVIEAGRMEEVELGPGPGGATQSLAYDGSWFSLYSTADEEQTRRAVVRVEQIFRAFRTFLPPRVADPERLTIELYGSLDQYRERLRALDLSLDNAAFYSPRQRIILAGSDLNLFAERLARVRREHEQAKLNAVQLEAEYMKTLAAASDELKAAGFTPEEAAAEIRLRKAVWKERMEALLVANSQRQRTNEQKVAEVTGVMFRGLYHEAFHAYLDAFVFPHQKRHVPRWLNEGLAQVFESGQFDGESLRIDAPDGAKLAALRADLSAGQPLSLASLLVAEEREFLGPHASEAPRRHYLYSWGLAYYLAFQGGLLESRELAEYVGAEAQRSDPLPRFEKLTGQPLGQFEREWRQALLKMK